MHTFPILLVDDEPEVADIFSKALSQQFPQASLTSFVTLVAAVAYLDDLANRCRTKLIIVDLDLRTEQSGLALIQTLRQHESCRLAPIIVLSGLSSLDWIEEAYSKGISAYTRKPTSYTGWKTYADRLRLYWYETVTTPGRSVETSQRSV